MDCGYAMPVIVFQTGIQNAINEITNQIKNVPIERNTFARIQNAKCKMHKAQCTMDIIVI